jgi:hypothetical protein
MFEITEYHIHSKYKIKSLSWYEDTLVDWVAGGHRYYLDGHTEPRHVAYSFNFDATVASPSGEYAVIYTREGTKGIVLQNGKIIREINRSFYHANDYEYPIALFRLKSGQEVLAHCPNHYNRLEIEDLGTGKCLTNLDTRKPSDFFFSRLTATIDGSFLLSAGWHWHPVDRIKVFNVEEALKTPSHLDDEGLEVDTLADGNSACFTENNRLVVALVDAFDDEEQIKQRPDGDYFGLIRVYDIKDVKLLSTSYPQSYVGTIMAMGEDYIVSFYEYPKLINLNTGVVIATWPHLKSGKQMSSILRGSAPLPAMAFDPQKFRFAIANENEITVIQLAKGLSE